MFLELILGSPAVAIVWVMAIFAALTFHEFSHAFIAKVYGDRTGEREGRLTLNPIAHIDPTGLILLLLFGFGWAKPVPYNPYNLKDPKWDSVKVALAGPISNLILAGIAAIGFQALVVSGVVESLNLLSIFLFLTILVNLFLLFFNLIPVHPLDGSKLFFALFDKPEHANLRKIVATRGSQILFIAVLISAFTPINIFFFISAPSFAICDAMISGSCTGYFASIFSLI